MRQKIKSLIFVLLAVTFVFLLSGCGEKLTVYESNNLEGYNVSVKFDANGGLFADNVNNLAVVDSFNANGKSEIALIAPDDSRRGSNMVKISKNGHFLAGWYKNRIEKTDENGNVVYEYSGKWDFENDTFKIENDKQYSATEPALTLYAAWVPEFKFEFYSLESGELISSLAHNPLVDKVYSLPKWNEETGILEMYDFPDIKDYTFNKAYYDADGTNEITDETVVHPGAINEENATATDPILKIYIDWTPGDWYRIYNVSQFKENANLAGCYELFADLDFTDEIWPTSFLYGNFTGEIKGNGHTIKNVDIKQTDNSKVNAGLFGAISDNAKISDVNFENITFTIAKGSRMVGTNYGLFAGKISDKADISGVNILSSHIKIDSSCYFMIKPTEYSIGLVCGMGDFSKIDTAHIDCTATGKSPEKVEISVSGNTVTVDFKK